MKCPKIIKKILTITALCGMVNSASAGLIKTDIVMIVDESGSMSTVQTNLVNNIGLFASILAAGGVDAQFALVGYGSSSSTSGSNYIRSLTDFVNATDFALAAANLVASGGTEPAFDASAFALNALTNESGNFTFRNDAVKNLIIYTDEPSNGDSEYDYASTDALIKSNNALYNAVLQGNSAINSLGGLATGNGGQVFDLLGLNTTDQSVVTAFVETFANAKLQETLDFCTLNPSDPACVSVGVPEPASLAIFALGLMGLAGRRKLTIK